MKSPPPGSRCSLNALRTWFTRCRHPLPFSNPYVHDSDNITPAYVPYQFSKQGQCCSTAMKRGFPPSKLLKPTICGDLQGNINYAVQIASLNKYGSIVHNTANKMHKYFNHLTNKLLTITDPIWFVLPELRMRTTCSLSCQNCACALHAVCPVRTAHAHYMQFVLPELRMRTICSLSCQNCACALHAVQCHPAAMSDFPHIN